MKNQPNELDPNRPMQGLGLINYLKLVFMTRAATIRQCDQVVDTLMGRMQETQNMLGLVTANYKAEVVKVKTLAPMVIKQHEALEIARNVLAPDSKATDDDRKDAWESINAVLDDAHKAIA